MSPSPGTRCGWSGVPCPTPRLPPAPGITATAATVRSYLDAGSASLSAGAVDRGLEEVADFLHRALSAEAPDGVSRTAAAVFRELGYLSVQRGVPDRAAGWLDRAMQAARGIPDEQGRILAIQGMLASDTAHYGDAVAAFAESRRLARAVGNRRQQAFSEALLGRVHLLRGDLELAGDHCCMARASGAEARLFLAHGDLAAAEHWIDRGLDPTPWYLWYTARLLDVAAEVTIATGSPRASQVVERLAALASSSGMREFVVRAQSHRAVLGDGAAAQAVPWLAKEIDNPARRRSWPGGSGFPREPAAVGRVRSRFRKPCPAVVRGTSMQLYRWECHRAHYCGRTSVMECITWFAPILPGKLEEWKAHVEELKGPRREQHEASRSRMGLVREVASLVQTPQGDFTCIFHEAEDLAKAYQTLAASADPYDVWFREHLANLHGMSVDMLTAPLPATLVLDYRAAG